MKLTFFFILLLSTSKLLSNDTAKKVCMFEGFVIVELRINTNTFKNYFEPYFVWFENFEIKKDTTSLITSIWTGYGRSFEDLKGCNEAIEYYDTTLFANIPNLNVFDTLQRDFKGFKKKLQILKKKYPDTKGVRYHFFYCSAKAMLKQIIIDKYRELDEDNLSPLISKPNYLGNASNKGHPIQYYFVYDFTSLLRLK